MTALRRRFVNVGGRRAHYLRMGVGPPAVLVHSSPTNAWYVVPQMRQLAHRFTCFAFDTPGFGLSQALPGEELSVRELSQALADNMAAIALPPCPVYGTHTGAAIALSLGAHHPERVTALVLDGVPIFSGAELDSLFEGYFEPLVTDANGGHFAHNWTRFRDQYVWFPWTHKSPEHHNEIDLGSAHSMHAWMMSFFHAGRTYKPAYLAATRYSAEAIADARKLRRPAIFTATDSDMLYPHLDRLPPLQAGQHIRRIGDDRERKDALILELFDKCPATGPAPAVTTGLDAGPGVHQQFIDLPAGQILIRYSGDPQAPTILLLHDAPGSGLMLAGDGGLLESLATDHWVLAPDLPGSGGSDALPSDPTGSTPPLAAWADAIAAACAAVNVTRACLYGIGIGASLALAVAQRHPKLALAVILRGLALPEIDERAELIERYAPPIVPQADGSHWYRTWLMLRDQQVWFPWYDARAARLRRVRADFGADYLHDWTFEVMKQHAGYHEVIKAAFAYDAASTLATLDVPLALCHDPQVPFFAYRERLLAACPAAAELPCETRAHNAALRTFLVGRRTGTSAAQ